MVFQFIKFNKKVKLSDYFHNFMNPDLNEKWPSEYLKFLTDFTNAAESELFDTKDQMLEYLEDLYLKNNNDVAEPSRINVNYVARLIYQEKNGLRRFY